MITSEAPGPPVRTGQARRGRSTELTALSISNGLPGNVISFHIVPLNSAIGAGLAGHVPARYLIVSTFAFLKGPDFGIRAS